MITEIEQRTLAEIAESNSVDDLRRRVGNATGKSEVVRLAAFARLISVSASDQSDPVARACWEMVYTIEEIRRENGKSWRMNRLRPRIEREGEHASLEYCARNRTDGFQEVLDYGLPEYTAEAIVLSFPDAFSDTKLRKIASDRLSEAGIDPTRFDRLKVGNAC